MEVRVKKEECKECSRCSEVQIHLVNTTDKCSQLELDIDKKNSRIELLESTLNFVELKILQLEDENRVLKQKNDDLETSLRNGKKEDEGNTEELELRVLELQKRVRIEKMKEGIDFSGIDSADMNESNENKDISSGSTPSKNLTDAELGSGRELKSRVRKPNNISPSTPGAMPSVDPIDFSDSDDDNLNLSSSKKRRVTNRVVTSDGESESDDNVPISKLMRKNIPVINVDTNPGSSSLNDSCSGENHKKSGRKRRLIKPGREALEISKSVDEVDDENEMEEDDMETESLDGFIVDGSDVSEDDSASDSEEVSENDESGVAYDEIISSLRREKREELEWEYEADMLAHFGKSSELCMKAVCALHRRQIEKYKSYEDDYIPVITGQGFNKYDASRGDAVAEFLTAGDSKGDVKKTVEELEEFDPNGIELCRKYATRYSKQLFEIYKNNEDPYFRP
ncbi:hypothetical protein OROMI_015272 [Orobanche minor]